MNSRNKIFFPNLDSLRFAAFFAVFLSHVLLIHFPDSAYFSFASFIRNHAKTGVLGVNFFFVLSGFLITYLLLKERNENGDFNIPKFYVRRIFRIWPLYFAIVLFSFVVVPLLMPLLHKVFFEQSPAIFYFTFTVNFAFIIGYFPYSSLLVALWSISVEEQFYFFWPWLLKFFKRNIFVLLLLIILVNLVSRFLLLDYPKALYFNTLSIISDFSIGGLIAFLSINYSEKFTQLFSVPKTVTVLFYISLVV
ncbi:MAG: acyltransferase, partial [Bacteroidota bacterium]